MEILKLLQKMKEADQPRKETESQKINKSALINKRK